ncbi:hypothetical protein [Apilactobacillus timberlakei]|uniref:hypothetical protein n=1 Tax=Apilactobacillus timberlakei TaxID=2008380 RepID=UPI001127D957|nr:hypothetical protein [Apilactobacillus timberlakei]TPR12226.1 hypothetical protein DYZ97_07030 [Apilactobacillus timberlakei]
MVDKALKRRSITAYNKLVRLYGVELEYAIYHESSNSNQSSDDGFGDIGDADSNTNNYDDWQKSSNELFGPTGASASSSLGNQLAMLSGSSVESYDYEWISKLDVPLKTKVRYKDKIIKVKKKADYDDMVGFFVYQLTDRSDDNVQR